MPAPTNSKLTAPTSVTTGSITVTTGASEPAKEAALYNHGYFLAAVQTALAASTSFADFQTRMAALPPTP